MSKRINRNNLKVGQSYTYEELCEALGDVIHPADEKQKRYSQYSKWRKHFKYSVSGKFKIEEVFEKTQNQVIVSKRDAHGGFEEWVNMCEYVRYEILKSNNSEAIPPFVINRLEALSKGSKVANNKSKEINACYQYQDMLTGYKLANAIMAKMDGKFIDGIMRFKYATAIVENKINDIARARRKREDTLQKAEKIEMEAYLHQPAKEVKYQTRKKKVSTDLLNKLK